MVIVDQPVLLSSNTNGQKMIIGDKDSPEGNYIYVAKLKGTHYQMGKAFGELFKEEISQNINGMFAYYLDQLQQLLVEQKLPSFLAGGLTNSARSIGFALLAFNVRITKRYTNPWCYQQIAGIALRDILYEAKNIRQPLKILTDTHRTCSIHLGLGSSEDASFRMLEYSQNILNNQYDNNYTHYNQSSHPQRSGRAYFDKHPQPSGDYCVGFLLANQNIYGKWQLQSLWRIIGNSHSTGDTQHVVFDLTEQKIMNSYSRLYKNEKNKTLVENAYTRSPFLVDMKALWLHC